MTRHKPLREPEEVADFYKGITRVLSAKDRQQRVPGACKFGVYKFVDYDGQPVYVGKTREELRVRIRRHLTNRRSDAAAMHVLDPLEVAEIQMWPFWHLEELEAKAKEKVEEAKKQEGEQAEEATNQAAAANKQAKEEIDDYLKKAEYTVFLQARDESKYGAVFNEVEIPKDDPVRLRKPFRRKILRANSRWKRLHPDIRLARQAHTMADLARVISERQVKTGIRRTLSIQARRLADLAETRLKDLEGQ